MEKSKQITHQGNQTGTTPAMFWGTLALGVIGIAAVLFTLVPMLQLPREGVVYYAMVIYTLTIVAGLTVIILTLRGRQDLGAQLSVYMLALVFVSSPAIFVGRALTASFSLLTISGIVILQLLPRALRPRYVAIPGAALILIGAVEWIDPSWRLQTEAGRGSGPVTAIIFGLILGVILVREVWSRNNIRSRFLTLSLGLTLIGTLVVAAISVNSFLSAGQQQQEIASDILRDQIRNTLQHQTVEVAIKNDVILNSISQDAQDVAQQAAFIFENRGVFTSETFWKADDHMFLGPQGQYMNSANDVSTIFVPNTVRVDEGLKQQLEQLAYLDMALVPALEDNPNAAAIYFVGKDEVSWLYPNINLGSIVPPDYLATQDIFYTIGSPKNNPKREVVWTPVYDDPGGQGLLVSAIAPVYARDTFMGVIGIDVSLASLTEAIETEDFGAGEGVYAFLIDNEGKALALPEQGYRDILGREPEAGEFGADLAHSARPEFTFILDFIRSGETGIQSVFVGERELFVGFTPLAITQWHIVSVADTQQVLAPAAKMETTFQALTNSLVYQRITPVGIGLMILVIVAGIFFTNRLVKPIEELTEGASKIGGGEWDTSLPKSELVEIDGLSNTLGAMARQLKGTLESLEQRVADRTHNLELAAEVGRAVSEVRDLDVMLKDACDLILKEFSLYYVQVYLTDPNQTKLVLEAGTGSVGAQLLGRGHNLPFDGNSINGRAAVEKRSVVISDTAESATFRQNPLLPDTRGEMAVPLIVANRVVGVLDMQSREPGVLNKEILPAFEALAGQLAIAIQNSNLLAETEEARAEVEKQARRLVRTGWNEHLDAIHKPEKLGFVFSQNEVTALAESNESQISVDGKSVSAPIAITGEPLGSLVVEIDDESHRDQTTELVNVVARQVAQQIENLRLLESAERYRYEAEEASRRLTTEGWKSYRERAGENLGYVYDLNEVRPQNNADEQAETTGYTLPLKVREETIGKLVVQGLKDSDEQSMNVANVVMERLGAHIESLRQFEETQRGQLELDKRAHQLAAVAEVSSVSARELDIQKMLASVVHLTQRKFGLYHAHVFTYTEQTEMLKIMACGWKEGDEHEGTHGTTTIPLNQEQSLVARAARTQQPVISNDVHNEPGWLPNPLLPDTQAELAVPLIIGDKILGVLDVQSDKLNAFSQEDASIFTTLAAQIATALQNAQSFVQAQKQAERESRLNVISQKIQSATTVEAVLQIAARELGHTLGAPLTIAQLGLKETLSDN
jgi:GAF domain-containing protein/HAMP domain-containing protein